MLEVTVRCRIDEDTKEKVGVVLDQMGMTLSTAIRLFLKRIAEEGTFPFALNRPARQDISGIKAALIEMINSGQVDPQGFASLLGDEIKVNLDHSGGNVNKGLSSIASLKPKKAQKP